MGVSDAILGYKDFLTSDNARYSELLESVRTGRKYITLDFLELARHSLELSTRMLDQPEEALKEISIAIGQVELGGDTSKFNVFIKNLPNTETKLIAEKRKEDLGKLLSFEGIVRSKSKVDMRVVSSKYECPACGNIIPILQTDPKQINRPNGCGCGRKGRFILRSEEIEDIQYIDIEELPEKVNGNAQSQRLRVLIRDKLVDPFFEFKFNPGSRVMVNGFLTPLRTNLRNGATSREMTYLFEALYIENIDYEELDLNITSDEEKQIKEISTDTSHIEILRESLIPDIYGHEKIKESLLLQIVGGRQKIRKDAPAKRGDIHILVIGDPGSGKSSILKRVKIVVPSARQATGMGSSGVGLTAAVIRDEVMGWSCQAGTLVLAHKSLAILDELDKMQPDDRNNLHEAMEQQTVTVSKAGIHAELKCQCSILAGANPKFGRFRAYDKTLAEQIDLPPTLINRFDLIFPVKDLPDKEKDIRIADKILETHTTESAQARLELPLLRKYLHKAKSIAPIMQKESIAVLKEYYVSLRSQSITQEGVISVPISPRQVESLTRLAEAYAKLRLSATVDVCDAQHAIKLLDSCLREIAFDQSTGTFDIDRITQDLSSSQKVNISRVDQALRKLEEKVGVIIPIEDLEEAVKGNEISPDQLEEIIQKMKKKGGLFEPRKGFIQRL